MKSLKHAEGSLPPAASLGGRELSNPLASRVRIYLHTLKRNKHMHERTSKKTPKSASDKRPKERTDIAIGRAPESTYLASTRKPNLTDRAAWVKEAAARGVST